MLKVISVTNNAPATERLRKSLVKHGWNHHFIFCDWEGFGTKLIKTYEYLKQHTEVTEFIFCDAFDVVVLGGVSEFREKLPNVDILCSSERGCWPVPEWEKYYPYPRHEHRFNYLNSGLYYAKSAAFIELFELTQPSYDTDDQKWFTEEYLFNELSGIVLDTDQVVFNSHSFIDEGEYGYNGGRVQIMGNEPIWVHSNGRTVDEKLEELL